MRSLSCSDQMARLREWADHENHEILYEKSDDLHEGENPSDVQRPEWFETLALVQRDWIVGMVEVRAMAEYDAAAMVEFEYLIKRVGARIHFLEPSDAFKSGYEEFLYRIFCAQTYARTKIYGERMRARMRMGGTHVMTKAPYGWDVKKVRGKWTKVPNHEEQEMIEDVKKLRDEGHTYAGIARILNKKGLTKKNGKPFEGWTIKDIYAANTKPKEIVLETMDNFANRHNTGQSGLCLPGGEPDKVGSRPQDQR